MITATEPVSYTHLDVYKRQLFFAADVHKNTPSILNKMYEGGSVIIPAETKISSRADDSLAQTKPVSYTHLCSEAYE